MKTNLRILFVLLCIFGTASAQAASNPRWERTISHSPVSVKTGQYMTFYTTIEVLQGPVDNLEISGGVDNIQLLNKTIPRLDRNQKLVVSFHWKSEVGNHQAYFQIDPKKKAVDSNRVDNRVQLSFSVSALAKISPEMSTQVKAEKLKPKIRSTEPPKIDLYIKKVECFPGTKRNFIGDPVAVTVTIDAIDGEGNIPHNGVGVGVCPHGTRVRIDESQFGNRVEVASNFTAGYPFDLCIDTENEVEEQDEDNNRVRVEPPGRKPVNLTVCVSNCLQPKINQEVTIRATVKNKESGSTQRPCRLRFDIEGKGAQYFDVPVLQGGKEFSVVRKVKYSTKGTRRIWAKADYDDNPSDGTDGKVTETSEDDNEALGRIRVRLPHQGTKECNCATNCRGELEYECTFH